MTQLSHRECHVRLLAEPDGSLTLHNGLSGESTAVGSGSVLQFDGAGWAALQLADGTSVPVKSLLKVVAFKSENGQVYFFDKSSRETSWQHKKWQSTVGRFPTLLLSGLVVTLAVWCPACPLQGQAVFFDLKPIQEPSLDFTCNGHFISSVMGSVACPVGEVLLGPWWLYGLLDGPLHSVVIMPLG